MSNSNAFRAANAYRATEVESRSNLELVVMLYDGLVRYLTESREAIARGDLRAKRNAISHALGILNHLRNTVDREKGGEIAQQLLTLYGYISGRVVHGNMQLDVAAIDEALRLIAPLREAWMEIASTRSARITA